MKNDKSQGMISISKFTGSESSFFGSDIFHSGGISIKISNGERERNLSREWYRAKECVVAVDLSYNQFVEMITSAMNTEGVPCTFRFKNKENIKHQCYVEDVSDLFRKDMENTNEELIERLVDLENEIRGLKVSNKAKKDLLMRADTIKSHLANFDFVAKCFDEKIDSVALEAKNSISNYIDHKIYSLGVGSLRQQIENPIKKTFLAINKKDDEL